MIASCSVSRHVIVALVSLLVERSSALARTCSGSNALGVAGGVSRDMGEMSWVGVVGVIDAMDACFLTDYSIGLSTSPFNMFATTYCAWGVKASIALLQCGEWT